jgi:predicted MFS family arabinose efflux permease
MSPLKPLRLTAFRRLALSYTLNELGWGFGTVALGIVVFDRTHSALATTALWIGTLLVPAFVGPAATARLDRLGVRRILPVLYLLEAAIFAVLALVSGAPWLPLVLALATIDGIIALVGRALTRAAVAATLKPHGLLESGNTLLNVAFSAAFAIGPALGGLVSDRFGIASALWVSAGLFLTMAVALATSRSLPEAHAEAAAGWLTRLRGGLRHALDNRAVRRLLIGHAATLSFMAMISPIEVIWAREVLDGGAGAYGTVLSAWGAGTLITGLLLSSLWRRFPTLVRVPLAAAVMGCGYVVMTLATSLPVGVIGCFIGGVGNGFWYVSVVQAVQERIGDEFQARVMGLLESVTAGAFGVGFLMAGTLTSLTSVRVTFAATAVGVLVTTAWMATMLRAARRTEEEAAHRAAADALGEDELDEAQVTSRRRPVSTS